MSAVENASAMPSRISQGGRVAERGQSTIGEDADRPDPGHGAALRRDPGRVADLLGEASMALAQLGRQPVGTIEGVRRPPRHSPRKRSGGNVGALRQGSPRRGFNLRRVRPIGESIY